MNTNSLLTRQIHTLRSVSLRSLLRDCEKSHPALAPDPALDLDLDPSFPPGAETKIKSRIRIKSRRLPFRLFTQSLIAIGLLGLLPPVQAQTFQNNGFETPALAPGAYVTLGTGVQPAYSWTFGGNSGIARDSATNTNFPTVHPGGYPGGNY